VEALLSVDRLLLFVVFFIPGLISLKIWSLLVPSERINVADRALEVLTYGALNFAALFWVIIIANRTGGWLQYLLYATVLLASPVVWPILVNLILKSKFMRGRIVHPTPRAWDAYFGRGHPSFILVHLKNGEMVGGLYSSRSFASSFPNEEDLYIEEVWKINENGSFDGPIEDTDGILLTGDSIEYLEFFQARSGDIGGIDEQQAPEENQ